MCHSSAVETASWISGPFLGFDLETTGKDRFTDRPVSFAFIDYVDGVSSPSLRGLVNPGRPIPEGAQRVHGISDAQVQAEGWELNEAVTLIADVLRDAFEKKTPIVGANLSYDLTMVNEAARDAGLPLLFDGGAGGEFAAPILDVIAIDRGLDRFTKRSRTLSSLAEFYKVPVLDAHDAAGDATMSILVLLAQIERFPELGEISIDELTLKQREWRMDFFNFLDKAKKKDGEEGLAADEFIWPISKR